MSLEPQAGTFRAARPNTGSVQFPKWILSYLGLWQLSRAQADSLPFSWEAVLLLSLIQLFTGQPGDATRGLLPAVGRSWGRVPRVGGGAEPGFGLGLCALGCSTCRVSIHLFLCAGDLPRIWILNRGFPDLSFRRIFLPLRRECISTPKLKPKFGKWPWIRHRSGSFLPEVLAESSCAFTTILLTPWIITADQKVSPNY